MSKRICNKKRIPWNKGLKLKDNPKYKNMGFQKEHPIYEGSEKGWFTTKRCLGNQNGFTTEKVSGDKNPSKRIEVRQKISKALKGRRHLWQEGKNHHNWQGGKSFEDYPKEFYLIRNKILDRDNKECKKCGKVINQQTKKLFISVHHIDYNKKNNKENNLITLCNVCNSAVNFNKEYWKIYFQEVI